MPKASSFPSFLSRAHPTLLRSRSCSRRLIVLLSCKSLLLVLSSNPTQICLLLLGDIDRRKQRCKIRKKNPQQKKEEKAIDLLIAELIELHDPKANSKAIYRTTQKKTIQIRYPVVTVCNYSHFLTKSRGKKLISIKFEGSENVEEPHEKHWKFYFYMFRFIALMDIEENSMENWDGALIIMISS